MWTLNWRKGSGEDDSPALLPYYTFSPRKQPQPPKIVIDNLKTQFVHDFRVFAPIVFFFAPTSHRGLYAIWRACVGECPFRADLLNAFGHTRL